MLSGLGLCAGIGGLELGLTPFGIHPTCFVERNEFCQLVLRKHWPDIPIWDDVTTFPGGRFDVVTAGFPCQPWSVAGKRKGVEDERWLWPDVFRVIRNVGPSVIFLENVPGLLSPEGLENVLKDLALGGFDAEWDLFRASDVGAPHKRERIFILGYTSRNGLERWRVARGEDGLAAWTATELAGRHKETLHCGDRQAVEDADGVPKREQKPQSKVPVRTSIFPPRPDDITGWNAWDGPQPGVRRGSDGLSDQVERTTCLGNAVCPPQATLAFATLVRRALR